MVPLAASAGSVTYEYDEAGRLKRATFDGTTQVSYGLDAAGNRTALTTTATPAGTLQFTSGSFTHGENQGSATITVSRTGGTTGAASISYAAAAGGSATSGADYTLTPGTLNWANGDGANKSFSVTIVNDFGL